MIVLLARDAQDVSNEKDVRQEGREDRRTNGEVEKPTVGVACHRLARNAAGFLTLLALSLEPADPDGDCERGGTSDDARHGKNIACEKKGKFDHDGGLICLAAKERKHL